MLRSLSLIAATAAMAAAPIPAQAAPPRTPAPVTAESEALGGAPFLIPIVIAIVVALGIVLISDDDSPTSP